MFKMKKRAVGISLGMITALFYGMYPATVSAVYQDGGNATFMIIATTMARMLCMLIVCGINRRPIFTNRADTKVALWGGLFQIISVAGIFASFSYIPGPVTICVVYLHTLIQMLYMAWTKEIALNKITVLTTISALCGITLVLDIWHHQSLSWFGVSLAFIGAVTAAIRMYMYGHQTKARNPAVVGAENFVTASLMSLVIIFFKAPEFPVSLMGYSWAVLGCLSIALGTLAMFYGISLLGSFSLSMIIKLEPIFTALFAILFIGEYLNWHQYLGILVVIGSLVLFQYAEHKSITQKDVQ